MTDYLTELQKIEKASQEAKITKAKLEQKLEQLQEEKKKILADLQAQGVTEETLAQTIETLQADIENNIDACNAALN
jgi:hypothetical protein